MVNGISRGHMLRCMLLRINGGEKMDYKTKLAVLGALRYRFENDNCKVNLPKETYAKALENF